MKFIIVILLGISCASCHLQTNFRLTREKISFNHDISWLQVTLTNVDSFGADGFPVLFTPDTIYFARGPRYLSDEEVIALLPDQARAEFLQYLSVKDSIIRNKINDTLVASDKTTIGNFIKYRQPGIHRSIEWDRADHKTHMITSRYLPDKKKRSFQFSRNTSRYYWGVGAGNWYEAKTTISGFRLIAGRWYTAHFAGRYGLFVSGSSTLLFSTDKEGNITCRRTDYKKDSF